MSKLNLSLGVLAFLFATSALADVTVIPAKIAGRGYKIGNAINIGNPHFVLGDRTRNLYADKDTAEQACSLLNMTLNDFQASDGKATVTVAMKGDAFYYQDSARYIETLSCNVK